MRELGWIEHTDGGEWYSDDDPIDNLGLYWIRPSDTNPGEWDLVICGHRQDSYATPDIAKSWAQADYEARIKSALSQAEGGWQLSAEAHSFLYAILGASDWVEAGKIWDNNPEERISAHAELAARRGS